jgi:hypothetical protein
MVCHDPQHCQAFPFITNSATCKSAKVCIPPEPLPDVFGLQYVNITSANCTSRCSHYCLDPKCVGSTACNALDVYECQDCIHGVGQSCPAGCKLNIVRDCSQTECNTYGYIHFFFL